MASEDTTAGNGESATGIKVQTLMDLFSLKDHTILVTGEWAASNTGFLAICNMRRHSSFPYQRCSKAQQEDWG